MVSKTFKSLRVISLPAEYGQKNVSTLVSLSTSKCFSFSCCKRIGNHCQTFSVYGEFRFSKLPMPPPVDERETGGRLSGEDMCNYLESFSDKYLQGKFRFNTEVVNIKREASQWLVKVQHRRTGQEKTLNYSRIILCTGVCADAHYIGVHLSRSFAIRDVVLPIFPLISPPKRHYKRTLKVLFVILTNSVRNLTTSRRECKRLLGSIMKKPHHLSL